MIVELIRHGKTIWHDAKRYQGSSDVPLSEAGKGELRPASHCPQTVYITPLQRTRQTAELLFPTAHLVVVEDLREMDFGAFEGRSAAEMAGDPAYRTWVEGQCQGRCPGGENLTEFSHRIRRVFARLLDQALAAGEERVTIVAHGGTQMAALSAFAQPARNYFAWQSPCGQGYLLDGKDWQSARRLHLLEQVDHTTGGR